MKSPALLLEAVPRLTLQAESAADLMTASPVSLRDTATVREGVALLIDKGISAAPVIDEGGRPVGVLSRTDLLIHAREKVDVMEPVPEFYDLPEPGRRDKHLPDGFHVEYVDRTLVRDIMTPAVFSVAPDAPAHRVIEEMLALKVHRLFVVDDAGVLIGVISILDILRYLRP